MHDQPGRIQLSTTGGTTITMDDILARYSVATARVTNVSDTGGVSVLSSGGPGLGLRPASPPAARNVTAPRTDRCSDGQRQRCRWRLSAGWFNAPRLDPVVSQHPRHREPGEAAMLTILTPALAFDPRQPSRPRQSSRSPWRGPVPRTARASPADLSLRALPTDGSRRAQLEAWDPDAAVGARGRRSRRRATGLPGRGAAGGAPCAAGATDAGGSPVRVARGFPSYSFARAFAATSMRPA